jgi:hypothetical protein
MRVASQVLVMLVASVATAHASCADDMKDVRLKVEQAQKTNPSAQTEVAAKELERYSQSASADEVDCYNAIARIERALKAPAPADNQVRPGQPVGPIEQRANSER